MIRAAKSIIARGKYWNSITSCWIINHFGKNPIKGGKPPKDNKEIRAIIFNRGDKL